MESTREEICRTVFDKSIAVVCHVAAITGGSCWVAGDHDKSAWCHFKNSIEGRLVTALAWRIDYDNIGSYALLGKTGGDITCIAAYKSSVGYAVGFGILLGVFYCLGNYFHTDKALKLICHGKSHGACAAVKVHKDFITCEGTILSGDFINIFGGRGIDLIEGMGRDSDIVGAHGIMNTAVAEQSDIFLAQNHIGILGIDIKKYSFDLRELGSQM